MFAGLIGNKAIGELIEGLLNRDRLPQSSIFLGVDGIGKKQFAIETAQALVCENSKVACGRCSPCKRATRFSLPKSGNKKDYESVYFSDHPDVGMVIPNKQTLYIDAIRDLEREANFRPFEAKKRIFIIEEAEKMSQGAANALLKTLEEPTKTTCIILITSKISKLLPTIRSRCQTFRFAPIPDSEIASFLFESKNYSSADSQLVARVAKGSISAALDLSPEELRIERDQFIELIERAAGGKNYSSLLKISESIADQDSAFLYDQTLSRLEDLVRDCWLIENGFEFDIIEDYERIEEVASKIGKQRLAFWITDIVEVRENLQFNLNRKVASDSLIVALAG